MKANAIEKCWNAGDCDVDNKSMILIKLEVFLSTNELSAIGGDVGCSARVGRKLGTGIQRITWLTIDQTIKRWE
jgi:hypothetical protein